MSYQRITLQLDNEIVEKAKNIAYWEPSLTLRSFVEKAIEKQLEIYEEVHRGPAVQRPNRKLHPGRPIE